MPVAFDLARRDVAYTTVQPLAIVVYLDVVEDFLSPYAEWPPATTAYNPQRLSTPIEARSISAKHSPRSSISSTSPLGGAGRSCFDNAQAESFMRR
jgi:hypothetical protein